MQQKWGGPHRRVDSNGQRRRAASVQMTGAPSERYAKLVVCGAKERGWLVKASQMVDGEMGWDRLSMVHEMHVCVFFDMIEYRSI